MQDVQDAVKTYDCKFPNCTNEVRSPVGRYSYCETHRDKAARGVKATAGATKNGVVARSLKDLTKLAVAVDKAHEKARKLTEQALQAKHDADAKAAQFRSEARRLLQDDDGEVRSDV